MTANQFTRILAHIIAFIGMISYIFTYFIGKPEDFTFTLVIAIWLYVTTLDEEKPAPSLTGRSINYERD